MKTLISIVGGLSLALVLNLSVRAKEWRGIVPLHSTRADVERLIGKPNSEYDRYDFKDERARVMYSAAPCDMGWDVPRDTVLSINVQPKGKVKLSDLRISLNEYEKFREPYEVQATYLNRRDGIRYVVFEGGGEDDGLILNIYYEAAERDKSLRCKNLPPPLPCVRPPHLCPRAEIAAQSKHCAGPAHMLAVNLSGVDPEDTFTFNWSVSAGEITEGQGTSLVSVDASGAGGPVVVTVEVVSSLCEACPIEASYTIEPCRKSGVMEGGKRRPGAPIKPRAAPNSGMHPTANQRASYR
jgi:hypothetical protein